jgi:hypothetical protein
MESALEHVDDGTLTVAHPHKEFYYELQTLQRVWPERLGKMVAGLPNCKTKSENNYGDQPEAHQHH